MSLRSLLMRLGAAVLLPCLLFAAANSLFVRGSSENLELVRESVAAGCEGLVLKRTEGRYACGCRNSGSGGSE